MREKQQVIQLMTQETGFDACTIRHQKQVARISSIIAAKMGLSDDRILCVTLGAAFHDIGKLFLPKRLLNKNGGLSDAEYGIVKKHCLTGMTLLKAIGAASCIYQTALQHHERLDGSGYPQGLTGSQVSLESRIAAVADVFDAMTHNRPYRPALSIDGALDKINTGRGTLYDPEVVDILCSILNTKEGWEFHADNWEITAQLAGQENGHGCCKRAEQEGSSLRGVRGL